MKVVAIVGMAGSGKSEVSKVFENHGYIRVRFGDITDEEMKKRGLPPSEASERIVRESLRKEHGMVAYAKLNLPKISAALERSNVVCDGLYSWEEYLFLKDFYKDQFCCVAVWAAPQVRYQRLLARAKRGLTLAEAASRDKSEIENINKGGPIAMADDTVLNCSSLEDLQRSVERMMSVEL